MSIADHAMTTSTAAAIPLPPPSPPVPPLHNGDRLTRAEFERRYSAMSEVQGAELIEGIVYMPSPVRHRHHSKPHVLLIGWIGFYVARTPGLEFGGNATNRLDEDNEPQPDVMLFLPEHAGGTAVIDDNDYVSGAPELVCEVSASTVSIDMHGKKNVYRRNGVKEYIVWRTEEAAIDWFELVEGRYDLIQPDEFGCVHSKTFPGLWLNAPALLRGDLAAVLATVDAGAATPEHAEFAKRIAAAKA
jgi:hypothetical protein